MKTHDSDAGNQYPDIGKIMVATNSENIHEHIGPTIWLGKNIGCGIYEAVTLHL